MFKHERRFIILISLFIGIGTASFSHLYIPYGTKHHNACLDLSERPPDVVCDDALYGFDSTKYGFPFVSRSTQQGGELVDIPTELESLPNLLLNVLAGMIISSSVIMWPRKRQVKRHRRRQRKMQKKHAHTRH